MTYQLSLGTKNYMKSYIIFITIGHASRYWPVSCERESSSLHSPAKQRGFSPLQKWKNPFCKGIPLTWHVGQWSSRPGWHLLSRRSNLGPGLLGSCPNTGTPINAHDSNRPSRSPDRKVDFYLAWSQVDPNELIWSQTFLFDQVGHNLIPNIHDI
jgi:hypothetical protein